MGAVTLGGKITGGTEEIEGSSFDINGGTIDGVTLFGSATAVSGSDTTIITGTAGDAGDLTVWNADGDLVSAASPAQANDFLVATAENTWAVKTLAETGAILEADIDHGNLQGTGDDDHTIYLLADGSRALAGAWDMDNQNLTNVDIDSGSIDGVTIGSNTLGNNAKITMAYEPTSDEQAQGTVVSGTVDTNTAGYGGVVYLNSADGNWDDADKDAEATAGNVQIGMVLSDSTGGTLDIMLTGIVRQDAWDFTAGEQLYIGDSGAIADSSDVAAYGTSDIVRVIGFALTDDSMYFNPSKDYIEVA
jgi:hypothetical protein